MVSGEAQTKKIGVLDVRGKEYRLHPVPLTQVRSFVTTELSLREHRSGLDPEDPKIDSKVSAALEDEVRYIANSAREKQQALLNEARKAGNDAAVKGSPIKYKLQKPNEVLVRIRVEHNGFSTLNNQRFGAKFVGDVANPSDMLLFHRKKDPNLASKIKTKKIQPMAPEEIEQTNMEDLIRQQLDAGGDSKMQVFGQESLSEAMEDYVEKSVTAAITDIAADILLQKTKALIAMSQANNEVADDAPNFERESEVLDVLHRESQAKGGGSDIDDAEVQASQKSASIYSKTRKSASTELDDIVELPKSRSKKGVSKKPNPLDTDDDEDDNVRAPPTRGGNTVAKKPALDSDGDSHDDDSFEAPTPYAKKGPAPKKAKAAPLRKRKSTHPEELSDVDKKPANAASKARARRVSAKKPVKYAFDSDDDAEDELDPIIASDDEDDSVELKRHSKRKNATGSRSKASSKINKTITAGKVRNKTQAKGTRRNQFDDSDEDVEYMGTSQNDHLDADWGSAATRSQF